MRTPGAKSQESMPSIDDLFTDAAANRIETLVHVAQAFREHRDPNSLFEVIVDQLRQVINFNFLMVVLHNLTAPNTETVLARVVDLPDVTDPSAIYVKEDFSEWIENDHEPIVIPDVTAEQRFAVAINSILRIGIQSCCILPLAARDRKIGTLVFGSRFRNTYNQKQMRFLSVVVGAMAVSIDDAFHMEALQRSEEKSRTEHDQLKLLLEFTNIVASNLTLRELMQSLSASVRNVMKCDSVWINLADEDEKNVRVVVQDFPEGKGYFDKTLVPIKGSVNEIPFFERKPLIMNRPEDITMYPEEYWRVVAEDIRTACLLPLISRNRVLGVLSLARLSETRFQEDEVEFLMQVANQLAMAVENALAYEEITALKERLAQEKLYLENEIRNEIGFEEIIGQSPALLTVLKQIDTVAATDSNVLILGETGTGKELIARAIHNHSRRKDRMLVKLNCAAIPTGLLESELFGHEKGAFTGAIAQRIGRMELADEGTLFLDEVGDIPLELQSKLLRVLQEREFERLGSSKTRKVDVRLIVATHRELQKMIADNQFRNDLYYRLSVFPIRVPALRERSEDIPLLVRHFTQKHALRMNKQIESIPANVLKKLTLCPWPGNVRELENFIERSVILTQGNVLNVPLSELTNASATPIPSKVLEQSDHDELIAALKESKGRVGGPGGAAERLGLKRTTVVERMKKYGINPHKFA